MSRNNRIVWSEGMFLTPHHFQQWDGYVQGEIQFRQEAAAPFAWGIWQLQIDQEALANGRFALHELAAVLPDGTAVRAPAVDPLPSSRPFAEHFAADQLRLEVFLALPEMRPGVPACSLPDRPSGVESRHLGELRRVGDEVDPARENEILVARQNLKILFGNENLDGHTVLKVAEVQRSAEGAPALSRDYAPPSLSLAAAGPAPGILRAVHENLVAKSAALTGQTRQRSGGVVEFGTADVGNFWLLHTVNSHIPLLAHYQRTPHSHPVNAYLALARLAGALCTFTYEHQAREVPPYQHEALGATFRGLEKLLLDLLNTVMPSRFVSVPLERQRDNEALLVGGIADERLLDPDIEWYLSVAGDVSTQLVRESVPSQVIIGSPHNIGYLIMQAIPGIVPVHVPVPPKDFPLRADHTYFRLEKRGTVWEAVRDARAVAVYLGSPQLLGLNVEIIAMK